MRARTTRNICLFLAIGIVFLIGDNLLIGQDRTETLVHGLFLHRYSSTPGTADPIIASIVKGDLISARVGEGVLFHNGKTETWAEHRADSAGWFRGDYLNSAYGYFVVNSDNERVVLLEGMGDQLVYVNGVPRAGNQYQSKETWEMWEPVFNYSLIPVVLKKGANELLFLCTRGYLKVNIHHIGPQVRFNSNDVTVPDFLVGQKIDYDASVVVVNASNEPLSSAFIKAKFENGAATETRLPVIQPMSLRKVRFRLTGPALQSPGRTNVSLDLSVESRGSQKTLSSAGISVKVVPSTSLHNRTYISDVDSSVQFYAVLPPRDPEDGKPKALFLSLHGAGVVATNMAQSYYPKAWGYIVCPTNRRPYGFDWEDWGRIDALQVLNVAKSSFPIDPNRIYLTGHSMGGHGTWVIGGLYPDQFAAIGPSAGWISWWTYRIRGDSLMSPIGELLRRVGTPNDPFRLAQNYNQVGVYILHGTADDNVPIAQAISMADTLGKFHKDFVFHKEPGVGHWWDKSDEAGTDCVDWTPMFDYFAKHALSGEERIKDIDFTTPNPGVTAKDYWLTIGQQEHQLQPTRVRVRFDPSLNRFAGTTENARMIAFDLDIADRSKPLIINLDSTKLADVKLPLDSKSVWLQKDAGDWHVSSEPSPNKKNPDRYGTFKDAFRNDVLLVYGTHGTRAENEWAFDKARFDAEYFWYQGNGSIDIVSDKDFNPAVYPDRNVIIYGNEKTNSAWGKLLEDNPVTASKGEITVGKNVIKGDDYTCLMVRPRKGSTNACVGVVAGTGITGMRLSYVVPYLQPGFALPDLMIFNLDILSKGYQGVKMTGFFGLDWSVDNGEFVEQ